MVFGFVEKLERLLGEELGHVSVRTFIDEKSRNTLLELGDPDYQVALEAQREARPISCVGDLVNEGRSWHMRNPQQFRILESEENGFVYTTRRTEHGVLLESKWARFQAGQLGVQTAPS